MPTVLTRANLDFRSTTDNDKEGRFRPQANCHHLRPVLSQFPHRIVSDPRQFHTINRVDSWGADLKLVESLDNDSSA